MMMRRKDHRRSTEWEGGFKRSAVKEKHARRRCIKRNWTYVDYIGTKGMITVEGRWIFSRKEEYKHTHTERERERESDMAKRRKYGVVVWKK